MGIDYEQIAGENKEKYGTNIARYGPVLLANLYSDRTHFLYELLQNAEDAGAEKIAFYLSPGRLEVRHNGRPFNAEDVRAICGLVEGTKADDLTKIGRFGIGFKSVYAYTRAPEIYSGEEVFCIENYVRPRCLSNSGLSSKDETLFVLPFNHDEISAEEAFQKIAGRLKNLGPRTLLFLKNLKEISWQVESEDKGLYLRETPSSPDTEGVRRASILWEAGSKNGEEVWLVFERPLPGYRENLPDGGTPKVEAAFSLGQQKGTKGKKIVPVDGAGLVVFFPTEKDTCLHFLIQGPYQTTPARDNVPQDNKRNKELIQETALLVAEALVQIKEMGLLTADFLDVLPQKADFPGEKGEMFRPVLAEVRKALQNEALLPAVDGSHVPAEQALLARTEALRSLLGPQELADLTGKEGMRWLDGGIRDTAHRRFTLVHSDLGVPQWDPATLVARLEQYLTGNPEWLKSKSDEWMARFYALLADQSSLKSKLLTLPILRLTDNRHVVAKNAKGDWQAYLPPEENDLPETAGDFPLVKPEVMRLPEHKNEEEDSRKEIDKPKKFLKDILGLNPPQPIDVIREYILQYKKEPPPSPAENLKHFQYIRDQINKMRDNEKRELLARLQDTRWLMVFSNDDREKKSFYSTPYEVYFPDAYTGNYNLEEKDRYFKTPEGEEVHYTGRNLLETYFAGYGACFLVDDYSQLKNQEKTVQFLKELGVEDKPRRISFEPPLTWQEKNALRGGQRCTDEIELTDYRLEGLDSFMGELHKLEPAAALARSTVLWQLLLKHIRDLKNEWDRHNFFRCEYRWFYRTERYRCFDADFFKSLLNQAWLPDCAGKLHRPGELFASDEENKRVLGDAVPYLHPFFSLETEEAKWLAGKLGVRLQTRPEDMARYLIQFAKDPPDHKRIDPLYKFFDDALRRGEKGIEEALKLLDNQEVWRGKFKGGWKYFAKHQLLLDDHEQRAELFSQNGVPVWSKDYADRFRDLTKWMELRTCSSILPESKPEGEVDQDEHWTERINSVLPYIRVFLQSFNLQESGFPDSIIVKWCDKVKAHYRVNGTEIIESSGQTSVLIVNNLFLPRHIDDEEIFDLVGEALQRAFDPAAHARESLREFIKDLTSSVPIERALERWRKRGLRVNPPDERDEQIISKNQEEAAAANETSENSGDGRSDAGKKINYREEIKKRFNRQAVKSPSDDEHVPPRPVADPERRRNVIEREIAEARQNEPPPEQRFKRVPVQVWEAKNYGVRPFLEELYGGKCQICNSTFYKRDGKPYFEGLYLVPHIHARWLDRHENVLSLCANCCAKFEHGAVEAKNIEQQIANWKCKAEGGMEEPFLHVKLCGEDVKIRFTERHMLDLQELCRLKL